MIITRTPFRVSYCGGGTDFPDYFLNHGGKVISSTIDKYIYVSVNSKFDGKINLRYSHTEEVNNIDEIQHGIIRECMRISGISSGVEIAIISDIPTKGSGLGGSSALTVGLLNALYAYKKCYVGSEFLAEMACQIELDVLQSPIGKQDQFSSAFGGLNLLEFDMEGYEVSDLRMDASSERIKELENNSMLFYTGQTREANGILEDHKNNITLNKEFLDELKNYVLAFQDWLNCKFTCIHSNVKNIPQKILNDSWKLKKITSPKSSNSEIDKIINDLIKIDGVGVKLCGAGGGGFMLVYCDTKLQPLVREKLLYLHELPFKFSNNGSEIIYNDNAGY